MTSKFSWMVPAWPPCTSECAERPSKTSQVPSEMEFVAEGTFMALKRNERSGLKGACEGLSAVCKSKSRSDFCHKENTVFPAVRQFSCFSKIMQGKA